MDFAEKMRTAATAAKLGHSMIDAFEEVFEDLDDQTKAAAMLATVQVVMMEAAQRANKLIDAPPRDTIDKLARMALGAFPSPPPPKVEDIPVVRNVKAGKSPWAL